jgi:hypothetical protein
VKFVIVCDRAPRMSSVCARCAKPIHVGYLRELTSDLPYCNHACYRRRNMALTPWSFAELDNFAFIGLRLAWDFQHALLDMCRN